MFSFILIAALITILTLILLVRPLLKTRNTDSYERQAQNIHFANQRLLELEQQLKNASISASDYEALKLEIESTLAQDIDLAASAQPPSEPTPSRRNGVTIALLCFLVPLTSLILYKVAGTPAALSAQSTEIATQASSEAKRADIESMLSSLETRLQDDPNDIQGWTMLARSYQALGRHQDALNANHKLLELGGENPDVYTAMADSSAILAKGILAGEPSEYVKKALALQENHPQALWLAGLSAAQTGNGGQARQYWNKLLPLLAGAPQQQQELQVIIDQSFDFTGPTTNTTTVPALVDNVDQASASVTSANSTVPSINIRVSIDPGLNSEAQKNNVVFVFARAKQGPPAPLAVKKLTVSDLPINIKLTDGDAMMDQFKLSRFDEVLVSARVARSGNPIAQPGDFQSGIVETKTSNTKLIDLNISQRIE